MRAFLLRSLIAAVLIGPAIGFAIHATSIQKATKYDPPVSEAEMERLRKLPFSDAEAALRRRAIHMTRWEWLEDSIHYAYFWKDVAAKSIVPSVGVFVACIWVGWMERRGALNIRPEGNLRS